MIKVIFFDLGEVVFTNDWHYDCPEKFAAFSNYYGITYDQMEIGWKKAWPLYDVGDITENEFWSIFLENAGAKRTDIDEAKVLWKKYFAPKPGMFDLLSKLKKHYTLAVLSSTGKEWLEYKIQKYNLNAYFSAYITSSNTKLKKTEKAIYLYALKSLNIKPEEAVFVDDTEKVLEVAKHVGVHTIRFHNAEQLTAELTAQNIIF
jgi:HAD superfamily hydrolase (TIGR01509 family)